MSLVGSLEDLGLADILQIVSLARKSGRLLLQAGGDAGRIILRDGLVCGAAVKGEQEDLRALLVGGGHVSAEDYARASEHADRSGQALAEAIAAMSGLEPGRIDGLRRAHVERAVMRMFRWRRGEFNFEVRDDVDPEDEGLLLPGGINTQYLAMEATRLRDESGFDDEALAPEAADSDEMVFSGESDAEAAEAGFAAAPASVDPVDASPQEFAALAPDAEPAAPAPEVSPEEAIALATARRLDAEEESADAPIAVESAASAPLAVPVTVAPEAPEEPKPAAAPPRAARSRNEKRPVIAMDSDLTRLEWLKASVSPHFTRVHIFQRIDLGVERIRQYLGRGTVPIVLAQPALVERESRGLLRRLRSLAPALPLFALVPEGRSDAAVRGYDGALSCPVGLPLDPELWNAHERLASGLCSALRQAAPGGADRAPHTARDVPLARLKQMSAEIRDPARQGDVLGLVLGFAAEQFSRVVVFMVRDEVAVGMAQRGLAEHGGCDDAALRKLELAEAELPALFREALRRRKGLVGPLGEGGDALAERLGGPLAAEAYVAPIESGGCVAALLYADDAAGSQRIADTTALEIVLHEAGLALDRALLERALADVEARS